MATLELLETLLLTNTIAITSQQGIKTMMLIVQDTVHRHTKEAGGTGDVTTPT